MLYKTSVIEQHMSHIVTAGTSQQLYDAVTNITAADKLLTIEHSLSTIGCYVLHKDISYFLFCNK